MGRLTLIKTVRLIGPLLFRDFPCPSRAERGFKMEISAKSRACQLVDCILFSMTPMNVWDVLP